MRAREMSSSGRPVMKRLFPKVRIRKHLAMQQVKRSGHGRPAHIVTATKEIETADQARLAGGNADENQSHRLLLSATTRPGYAGNADTIVGATEILDTQGELPGD